MNNLIIISIVVSVQSSYCIDHDTKSNDHFANEETLNIFGKDIKINILRDDRSINRLFVDTIDSNLIRQKRSPQSTGQNSPLILFYVIAVFKLFRSNAYT